MLESILVYTITAVLLYIFAQSAVANEKLSQRPNRFWTTEIVLSILLFGFISGARYGVGVDHLSYLDIYQRVQNHISLSRESLEPGFLFITRLFASSGLHYFFYFAFWGILQISFIYYALKDRKYLLPYVALAIMLNSGYFLEWMNGIRQCVVACASVFLIQYILDKKPAKYIISLLLLSLIHKSAVLLIPLYLLVYNKLPFDRKYLNLTILMAFVVLGMIPSWLHLMTNFANLLAMIGYDSYAARIELMVTENLRMTAWGPSRISNFLTGVAIIWYYPQMKEFYKYDRYLPIYFLLFFAGICLYNAFVNTSHIFLRPIEYLTIFKLPMVAYLLYYLKHSNNKMFLIIAVLVFSQIYFEIYKAVALPSVASKFTLYKFFFQ